jgi:hypothetical protein
MLLAVFFNKNLLDFALPPRFYWISVEVKIATLALLFFLAAPIGRLFNNLFWLFFGGWLSIKIATVIAGMVIDYRCFKFTSLMHTGQLYRETIMTTSCAAKEWFSVARRIVVILETHFPNEFEKSKYVTGTAAFYRSCSFILPAFYIAISYPFTTDVIPIILAIFFLVISLTGYMVFYYHLKGFGIFRALLVGVPGELPCKIDELERRLVLYYNLKSTNQNRRPTKNRRPGANPGRRR